MKGLTKKQLDILNFIQSYIHTHQVAPSFREIAKQFNFQSLATVHGHLQKLKKKGVLDLEKRKARSLCINSKTLYSPKEEVLLPFIGYLCQGKPIETLPQSQKMTVPPFFVTSTENTYVLKVKGESLQEELMQDGDFLIVEARPIAHSGEVVIASTPTEETVVRRYYPEEKYVHLLSQTHTNSPIILREEECLIQAVITSLFRSL